jgi:hypothetical protein
MEETPILASVERDLHISVDDLVYARDAPSGKSAPTPTTGTALVKSPAGK